MSNYKVTIGIEVHTQLNTKTKMFSSSKNSYDAPTNTLINEVDLALPGTMPQPNKEAVIKAIQLANELNMEIDTNLRFDRKNYFYQDLPKGYQITQQYFPIAKNGKLETGPDTFVEIERFHLEEDTAKQTMVDNEILLDYNRAGIPLIEIVTKPQIHSASEAVAYLTKLKRILTFLDISDGKMEEGSLRADINISISSTNELGTKVEIKNINSFANAAKAIEYETTRQTNILESGEKVIQETRRWDDTSSTTVSMRAKSDAIDYRYFSEPNILNIDILPLVEIAKKTAKESPNKIKEKLHAGSLQENFIELLLDNQKLYRIFDKINSTVNDSKLTATWLLIEFVSLLKDTNKALEEVEYKHFENLLELIMLIKSGDINGKQAKDILAKAYETKKSPSSLKEELGFTQITDENAIRDILNVIVENNPHMVAQYKERPERAEKFFIGMIMKETKGQANPGVANKVLKEKLS